MELTEETECLFGGTPIESYVNKKILAPMVRVGTLPFRLLSAEYGADISYSEEIIALKLQNTCRTLNERTGTVDFVVKRTDKGSGILLHVHPLSLLTLKCTQSRPVFSTNKLDHPNVLQLGTSDAVTALKAATVVARDVNGIDLNCGCPKKFSIQGGMGAALLSKPETIKDILSTLRRNLNNSMTCKIRLLDSVASTIDLLKTIELAGASAVAIHSRYIPDRPRDPAKWDVAEEVIKHCGLNIPIIINGDIFHYEDIDKVKAKTGASSVMIARGALTNASVFQPDLVPLDNIIQNYLKKCIDLDHGQQNTKYVVMQMLQSQQTKHKNDRLVQRAKDLRTLCSGWNMEDYVASKTLQLCDDDEEEEHELKRIKI